MRLSTHVSRGRGRARLALAAGAAVAGLALVGGELAGAASASSHARRSAASSKKVSIAFLTFAVANSYDQPMLAAAKAAAASEHASLTVLDANNNPATQLSQLQDATSSGKYNGIITEPIFGPGLIKGVEAAIHKGIKVGNVDEILGSKLTTDQAEVPGLSANVVFVSSNLGYKMGELTVEACAHKSPCKVGFMYDFKATPFDVALRNGYNQAIAAHKNIQVVTEGQCLYTITAGATAAQDMVAAVPDLNVIAGTDQGIEGAARVVPSKVMLIGYGGSAASHAGIASGRWFGDAVQLPATAGRLVTEEVISAIRTGAVSTGVDPSDSLPDGGIITKSNLKLFHAEWQG